MQIEEKQYFQEIQKEHPLFSVFLQIFLDYNIDVSTLKSIFDRLQNRMSSPSTKHNKIALHDKQDFKELRKDNEHAETLYICGSWNLTFCKHQMPKNIKNIIFENEYLSYEYSVNGFSNALQDNDFPKKLEILRFKGQHSFNNTLYEGIFPNTLRVLELPSGFNQPLCNGVLPEGLEELKFGNNWNQTMSRDIFPSTLKKLWIGKRNTQRFVPHMFPENLEYLSCENRFIQSFERDVFPSSLQEIVFHKRIERPFEPNVLPMNLKKLTFIEGYTPEIQMDTFPQSITHLYFGEIPVFGENVRLHDGLIDLRLESEWRTFSNWKKDSIPSTVRYLHIKSPEIPPNIIPDTVTHVKLESNNTLSGILPKGLKILRIGKTDIQNIEMGDIPDTLEELYFENYFHPLFRLEELPQTLRKISFLHLSRKNLMLEKIPSHIQLIEQPQQCMMKIYFQNKWYERTLYEYGGARNAILRFLQEYHGSKSYVDEILQKSKNPQRLYRMIDRYQDTYSIDEMLSFMGYS
jgi:hypothetical protein